MSHIHLPDGSHLPRPRRSCPDEWGIGWITENPWNGLYFVVGIAWLIGTFAIRLTTKAPATEIVHTDRLTKFWWWWTAGAVLASLPWAVPWLRARCVRARPSTTDSTHQDVWSAGGGGGGTELAAV